MITIEVYLSYTKKFWGRLKVPISVISSSDKWQYHKKVFSFFSSSSSSSFHFLPPHIREQICCPPPSRSRTCLRFLVSSSNLDHLEHKFTRTPCEILCTCLQLAICTFMPRFTRVRRIGRDITHISHFFKVVFGQFHIHRDEKVMKRIVHVNRFHTRLFFSKNRFPFFKFP